MRSTIVLSVLTLLGASYGAAAQNTATAPFPGDIGRPFNGLPLSGNPAEHRLPWPSMPPVSRGPSAVVAMQMAQRAVAACSGQHIAVSVLDASGLPKLFYVADGAPGYHAYTAFRKAYTALTFKMATSALGASIKADPAIATRITADTNLLAFPGGVPIVVGGELIGAIAVSGAEPPPEDRTANPGLIDEKCAAAGLDQVRRQLN